MPITESRLFGRLLRLAFVLLWAQALFPAASAEVLPYLQQVSEPSFKLPEGLKNGCVQSWPVSPLNAVSP